MPRIDNRFLDCSLYLYPSEETANRGDQAGGTGFLAAVQGFDSGWLLDGKCPQSDFHHCYAVTNNHVAKKNPVVRLNKDDGKVTTIPFAAEDWFYLEDHDVAVVPIEYQESNRYLFLRTDLFLTQEIAQKSDVGLGDEVFMVGRFINHDGRQSNIPSVRWGHIAMMPCEIKNEHLKKQEKSFCVEVHTIAGYSGSPVFVRPFRTEKLLHIPPPEFAGGNTACFYPQVHTSSKYIFGGPWLLGIQWGYLYELRDGVKHNTGMSGVAPAWHILDLLNSEKMIMQRRQEQEQLLSDLDTAGTTDT